MGDSCKDAVKTHLLLQFLGGLLQIFYPPWRLHFIFTSVENILGCETLVLPHLPKFKPEF